MSHIEHLKQYLNSIYDRNPFVHLLDMEIVALREGEAEITMPVDPVKHTNLYNSLHGGAAAALADTAMGVACATMGNRVVTIDLNINYIRNAAANDLMHAIGRVIHCGRQTMVVEAEILDRSGKLVSKSRGTFMITGSFEGHDHVA
jgi:1,4-dihydroxy-2-naphthoyl-CoA hydrolase